MRKGFKAWRPMGLFAAVLGLMAFGATVAQAEPGAYWEVGGTKIEGSSTLLPTIQAEKNTPHGTLLTKVGATTVEILCSEIKLVGAKLHTLGRATGKIHFSGLSPNGCETRLNGNPAGTCRPHSPGHAQGLIETNTLHGLLKLHTLENGTKDDLFEVLPSGPAGTPFVTLVLGPEGEENECAMGEKTVIGGVLFLKGNVVPADCENEAKIELLENLEEHLFEEGPLSALFFGGGGNPAILHGSAWAFLTGPHTGQSWSGHPA